MKSFGTGFPAVAARHGCQLPGHDSPDSDGATGHVAGHVAGHAAGPACVSASEDTHAAAHGQAVTSLVVNVATTPDTGLAMAGAVMAGRAESLTPVSATRGSRASGDGAAVAGPGRGNGPVTLALAAVSADVTPTAALRPVTSPVTAVAAAVAGLSPRRDDRWGYTVAVCCPVCELPIDPAWSAASRADRHTPCAAQPQRMADAARAHRAAHPATHRPGHRAPGRGSRRPQPPAPGRPASTRPRPTSPAPAAGPRAPHPRKDTTR